MKAALLLFLMLFPQQETPFRILSSELPKPDDRLKSAEFMVAVEQPMDRSAVERLVCRILQEEKPPKFEKLNVEIFLGVKQPDPYYELARYVWDAKLPRVRGRLVMMKNADGTPRDPWETAEFKHETACR